MSSGNQQLGFAIRAVNEASEALRDVSGDLAFMEEAAKGTEPELKNLSQALGTLETDVQHFADELEEAGGKFSVSREGLDQVAESAGNLEQIFNGVKDIVGVAGEQFGVSLGPLEEWSGAAGQVAGGLEGVIKGGMGLAESLPPMVAGLLPAIASSWAYVTALLAQAAAFIAANAPILLIVGGLALLAAGVVLLVKHWDDIQPHFQPVIDFFTGKVIPAFEAVWEKGLKPVIDFVANNWKEITTLVLFPFAPLIILATDAFGIRSATIGAVQSILDKFGDIAGFIAGLPPEIGRALGAVYQTIKSNIENFILPKVSAIIEAFKGIAGAIEGAFTSAIGFIVGLINTAISAYNKLPGVPDIQKIGEAAKQAGSQFGAPVAGGDDDTMLGREVFGFADGGIVPGPIGAPLLAVVHGGESVIPVGGSGGGGAQELHIHIGGNVYGVDNLLYTLDRALKRAGQNGLVA